MIKTIKFLIQYSLTFAVFCGSIYLLFSMCCNGFNVALWDKDYRATFVFLSLFFIIFAFIVLMINTHEEDNKDQIMKK